ncbi:hypothetical protein IAU59_001555 [Kwoniella sp. CBS 9459]
MDFFGAAAAGVGAGAGLGRTKSNTVVSKPKVKKGEKPIVASTSSQAKLKNDDKEKLASQMSLPSASSSKQALSQSQEKEGKGIGETVKTKAKAKTSTKNGKAKDRSPPPPPARTAKPIGRNPSVNAEEVFNSLKDTKLNLERTADKLEWTQRRAKEGMVSSAAKQKKSKSSDLGSGEMHVEQIGGGSGSAVRSGQAVKRKGKEVGGPPSAIRIIKGSQNDGTNPRRLTNLSKSRSSQASQNKSKALIPNSDSDSSDSASTSDDELSMGHTPDRNKHEGYRADEQLRRRDASSMSVSPSKPRDLKSTMSRAGLMAGPRTASRNGSAVEGRSKSKPNRDEVIVPSSPSGTLDDTPRPKLGKGQGKGKKRSSDDMSSSSDEAMQNRAATEKDRAKVKGTIQGKKLRLMNRDEATPRPSQKSSQVGSQQNRKLNKRVVSSDSGSSSSSLSSDTDCDSDSSPCPNRKSKVKAEKGRESLSGGHRFFDELVMMRSNGNDIDYEKLQEQGDVTMTLDNLDDDEDISKEDKAFLAPYRSATDQCPYCSEPMPSHPSAHLVELKRQLEDISVPCPTEDNPSARNLSWQQHIDFCSLHRAETSLIPLGIRDGYPEHIDFLHLEERLEQGWIRKRLDEIVQNPQSSDVFRRVQKEVEEHGKMRWGGIRFQSKEDNIAAVKPGYYGDLGRAIIINHFLNLRKWGYFPCLKSSTSSQTGHSSQSAIAEQHNPISLEPLSWHDFVSHVLVPESSILLIMQDRDHASLTDHAYDEAEAVRSRSVKYGTWKFREEGDEAEEILAELRATIGEKRKRLRKIAMRQMLLTQGADEKLNGNGNAAAKHLHEFEDEATPKPDKFKRNNNHSTMSQNMRSPSRSTEPNSVIVLDQTPPPSSKRRKKPTIMNKSDEGDRDTASNSSHHQARAGSEDAANGVSDDIDEDADGVGGEQEPNLVSASQESIGSSLFGADLPPEDLDEVLEFANRITSSVGLAKAR